MFGLIILKLFFSDRSGPRALQPKLKNKDDAIGARALPFEKRAVS